MAWFGQPLPATWTPFEGRQSELAALSALLRLPDTVRLLTLVGPPGVGKSRLAIEVATRLGPAYANRTCWIPLVSVATPAAMLPAIAAGLGLPETEAIGDPHGQCQRIAAVVGEQPALLVLDNVEHLLAADRELAMLLGICPVLRVLATSRTALRLPGELTYSVPPLPIRAASAAPTSAETDPDLAERRRSPPSLERATVAPAGAAQATSGRPATPIAMEDLPLLDEVAEGKDNEAIGAALRRSPVSVAERLATLQSRYRLNRRQLGVLRLLCLGRPRVLDRLIRRAAISASQTIEIDMRGGAARLTVAALVERRDGAQDHEAPEEAEIAVLQFIAPATVRGAITAVNNAWAFERRHQTIEHGQRLGFGRELPPEDSRP